MSFVSASCRGVTCQIKGCGEPAAAKVGEEIAHDDPLPHRHNLTAYVCVGHFRTIMGDHGVALTSSMREHITNVAEGYEGYGWIRVKPFVSEEAKSWEERYRDLEKHHEEETTFLIAEVRKLAAR